MTKLKTQIGTKHKNSNCDKIQNSNCDKTQKLNLWQNSKTQKVTKLKKNQIMIFFITVFRKNNLTPQKPMRYKLASVLQSRNVLAPQSSSRSLVVCWSVRSSLGHLCEKFTFTRVQEKHLTLYNSSSDRRDSSDISDSCESSYSGDSKDSSESCDK